MVKLYRFNQKPVVIGKRIVEPSQDVIKNTQALWNASLEDALRYGGDLTKSALGAMNLKFDKKHIIIDTKVHMLMPGFYPAIPGWHTDGVPRGKERHPQAKAAPNIFAQDHMSDTRFHLLVTGEGCLTDFLYTKDVWLDVPNEPDTKLYKMIDDQVKSLLEQNELSKFSVPSCTAVEFDWNEIHTGVAASKHEWRFLIRVTETDHQEPCRDLRKVLKTQQQVYVEQNFGW